MSGTLHGIGVGPGDPELLTLKAVRRIRAASVVAYPAPLGGESFARSIVAEHLAHRPEELRIEVPMRPGPPPAEVYDEAAARIAGILDAGRDVAVLCEGDPLTYGSFAYLHERLGDAYACAIVPGVSSPMACAAASRRPLVRRDEALRLVPGTLDDATLARHLGSGDAVAIMKVGRHLPRLRTLVAGAGRLDGAHYVAHAGLPDETACPLDEAPEPAPYFSMILIGAKA